MSIDGRMLPLSTMIDSEVALRIRDVEHDGGRRTGCFQPFRVLAVTLTLVWKRHAVHAWRTWRFLKEKPQRLTEKEGKPKALEVCHSKQIAMTRVEINPIADACVLWLKALPARPARTLHGKRRKSYGPVTDANLI